MLQGERQRYIGPNEIREIVNRGNEVCTIAVAVSPREMSAAVIMRMLPARMSRIRAVKVPASGRPNDA